MGGKAGKEFQETTLGTGTTYTDETKATELKYTSYPFKKEIQITANGVFQCQVVCYMRGMNKNEMKVYRDIPAYEGQLPTQDTVKKAPADKKTLYQFASLMEQTTMSGTGHATYSIITGEGSEGKFAMTPLYQSRKLGSMKYLAIIEDMNGVAIAKGAQKGMTGAQVEITAGVDMVAVVLTGSCMSGSG